MENSFSSFDFCTIVCYSFLNCFRCRIQGFRKIDSDKWEFAHEAFQRGKKLLLRTIQRRKSPQSSQQIASYVAPSNEAGKSVLEGEVERLRKEKSALMQEVVELQQQQRGTVHLVEAVNKRLQSTEQKQKQMVSFFAKMVQKPSFIARLKQKVEQKEIGSSRAPRKFVTQQPHEASEPDRSMEGQLVKYTPGVRNLTIPSGGPDLNPFHAEQGMAGNLILDEESVPFQPDGVVPDDLLLSDEITAMQVFGNDKAGEGASSTRPDDPLFKGKGTLSSHQEIGFGPEYYASFPEDLMNDKNFPELSSTGMETMIKQEDIWNTGLHASAAMSSGANVMFDTPVSYDVPEPGVTSGMFDIWDLGSLQVGGGSGIDKWPAYESPFDQPENQDSQPTDDKI